jgi:anti-sigma factor RsiW
MSGDGMQHPADALAEYAAGVLDPSERTTIETHLTACSSCRTALLGWTAVAAATGTPEEAPPSAPSVVRAALTRAALAPQAPPVRRRGVRFAAELLRAEVDLALEAYQRAREPKRLVLLPGGHFDAYVKDFETASGAARDWFLEHLGSPG